MFLCLFGCCVFQDDDSPNRVLCVLKFRNRLSGLGVLVKFNGLGEHLVDLAATKEH